MDVWERLFQAAETDSAKALGQQCTWHLIKRRSVCLESGEPGKHLGRWGGEAGMAGSLKAYRSGRVGPTLRGIGAIGEF